MFMTKSGQRRPRRSFLYHEMRWSGAVQLWSRAGRSFWPRSQWTSEVSELWESQWQLMSPEMRKGLQRMDWRDLCCRSEDWWCSRVKTLWTFVKGFCIDLSFCTQMCLRLDQEAINWRWMTTLLSCLGSRRALQSLLHFFLAGACDFKHCSWIGNSGFSKAGAKRIEPVVT